ncbi:hypothetical protein [Vibrio parahaemolyticus]|uniref:hypothetical protein n=1 Tax=Vibrio parahaemolyticus TaxID=670 RepID=UPI0003F53AC3|nr:hypothetical protein [Vibrio parahaemolyticus]MDF4313738.1 hypothetical protein [Vibrio parahaemolyticus]MDF4597466.1 hypothetical protein [Vibrio parahaemolyticus]TOB86137.1 hypothetical protein CGJ96_24070 [Vibrio parahaemolyticus]HCG5516591.1 hypothetical protein [Vibrio parahaemolyticus]HCG7551287.1 hypothetical protein [Vibrio parahaemolyticus]
MSAVTVNIPVQPKNTSQRILDNQLDQILDLITAKNKSLSDITKAYPKLTKVILDAATGKNKDISGVQLKAVQMALSLVTDLEKSIKDSEQIVLALEAVKEAEKAAPKDSKSSLLPKL